MSPLSSLFSSSSSNRFIEFCLDDFVSYSDGRKKHVCCEERSFFDNWQKGDYIEIDNSKTVCGYSASIFASTTIIKLADCCPRHGFNNLHKEHNALKDKYDKLERERDDLCDDRDAWKEKYENAIKEIDRLKDERLRENTKNSDEKLRLAGENSRIKIEKARTEEKLESKSSQLIEITRELEDIKGELSVVSEELSVVRKEKENQIIMFENKLDQKQRLLETARQSLEELKIKSEREKAEKDNGLKEKENKLKRKEEEIKRLKNLVGSSQEELLSERLRLKEEKLRIFLGKLEISADLEEKIDNLSKYYKRLKNARKNYNQVNIETHEDNIARIKRELRQGRIIVENVEKICHQCEKIANFRFELDEVNKQQYQARQEVPTN